MLFQLRTSSRRVTLSLGSTRRVVGLKTETNMLTVPTIVRTKNLLRLQSLSSLSARASRRRATGASPLDEQTVPIKWWYAVVGGLVMTTVGTLRYTYDQVGSLEGLQRSCNFYSFAIPKYVEYRYHMWKKSPQSVWDDLDKATSARALAKILQLQGFFCKCGQMCASNVGDAFPVIWQDTMAVLQDQVPPQTFETVKAIVSKELDWDATFSSFDTTPIGSASIGQVHRATLRDTGEHVVVKVCYPHVERLLRGDVRTVKLFAKLAQPVHVPALEEVEQQFATEFDYRREGQHLEEIRLNLQAAGWAGPDGVCQLPVPFLPLCTKHVLVMQELEGEKLVDGLRRDLSYQAEQRGRSVEAVMAELQGDGAPSQGPSVNDYQRWIALVDSQRRLTNLSHVVYNWTAGWVTGKTYTYADKSTLPLNHAQLVDDLLAIHGHEVLVDGVFNGDCHPGNILLLRKADGSPQLGLIDYGQVKRLTKEDRHLFCRIVLALADDDRAAIVRLVKEAGYVSKRMDPDVIYSYAKVAYDEDNAELTKGLHIQMFMEDLQARDPIHALPYDFIVIGRASLLLRGLAHALKQPRSVAKSWKPIAERVLREDL